MKITHISDPHFGCPGNIFTEHEIVEVMSEALNNSSEDDYLILTGDITYRGQEAGYGIARRVFRHVLENTKFDKSKIIICPGNHDITDTEFTPFNEFVNDLRGDNIFNFKSTTTCNSYITSDLFCISINSAYSLERGQGFVDVESLRETLVSLNEEHIRAPYKIAILHHHVINQYLRDKSVVKNAYEVIKVLDGLGFNLILHGHQHSLMSLKLGNTPILNLAVGSLNFFDGGYANGINTYDVKVEKLIVSRYTFSRDRKKDGKLVPVIIGDYEEY